METTAATAAARPGKRAAAKARSRQALIDATLDSIAERGIAGTSISEIVQRSGLSRGMVHLHFDSKEHLLLEAARSLAESYFDHLFRQLAEAPDSPEHRLIALIKADLGEDILNERTIAIWYAFRGEARSQNAFMEYSDTRDRRLREIYRSTCAELLGPEADARRVTDLAHGIIALTEGLWADYFLHSDAFDRSAAKRVVFRFLAAFLPDRPVFLERVEAGG
jgi:TetR/AcrR family transcriptional repressor of bet genes